MQHRVLLIADADRIDELEQFGSIPARLLQRRALHELVDWHVNSEDAFAVTPAEFFLKNAGPAEPEGTASTRTTDPDLDELRDWVTRGLQDTTIFYLTIVSQTDDHQRGLAQHVQRYHKIRERLLEAAGLRIPRLNLVQVVVFCDKGSTLEDCREFLDQPNEVGPVATCCHVMLPSLEGGAERTQVFDARHVWPLSVSGLLLSYLLHGPRHISVHRSVRTEARERDPLVAESSEESGSEQTTPIYAWRTYALRTELDPDAVNRKIQRAVADLGKRFAAENTGRQSTDWDATSVQLTPLAPQRALRVRDWRQTGYEHLIQAMRDGSRWEARRRAAGFEDSRRLSGEILDRDVSSTDEIRDVWRDVSADPTIVEAILNDRSRLRGFDGESEWQTRSEQWDELREHDTTVQNAIDRFEYCDLHLAAARKAYVEAPRRTLLVFVVAVLLIYCGLTVSVAVFESQWPGWLFAIAGTLGSAIAAFAFNHAEKTRGNVAAEELTQQVSDIDSLADERHRLATTSVARAEQLRRRRTRGVLNVRARGFLRRLLSAMSSALIPTEVRLDEGPASLVAPDISVVGRIQRRIFRELSECRQVCTVSMITDTDLTTEFMADFVQTRWKAFAESADRDLVGLYPYDQTKLVFEAFRAEFENRLLAETDSSSLLTTQISRDRVSWGTFLSEIRQQDYLETLSCPVEAFQLAVAEHRIPPVLLLSNALGDLANELVDEMGRSEVLSFDPRDYPRLPFVGLFVQYVELTLQADGTNGTALRVAGSQR